MFEDLKKELDKKPFLTSRDEIIPHLSTLLKKAIQMKGKVGIAFSGGVDSSVMALLAPKKILYSVGLQNSSDLDWAVQASMKMDWPLKCKLLSVQEAEEIIENVVRILTEHDVDTNVTNVGVACVVYAVLEMAKKDKINTVYGGLGAEEIFGGYRRHVDYGENYEQQHIHQRLWEGLFGLEERDIKRDTAIAQHFKINLVAPFLNKELVTYAMQIDPLLKITPKKKKIIFRETAISLGLPTEFAQRKKVAAQYGSKFDRVMLRLAKKKGFKQKKEYITSLQ